MGVINDGCGGIQLCTTNPCWSAILVQAWTSAPLALLLIRLPHRDWLPFVQTSVRLCAVYNVQVCEENEEVVHFTSAEVEPCSDLVLLTAEAWGAPRKHARTTPGKLFLLYADNRLREQRNRSPGLNLIRFATMQTPSQTKAKDNVSEAFKSNFFSPKIQNSQNKQNKQINTPEILTHIKHM